MFIPMGAARRRLRRLSLVGLACLTLTISVIPLRSGAEGVRGGAATGVPGDRSGQVQVLVGFKRPAFTIQGAARASLLSRSRERARIAGLRGRVARQFLRTDAVAATVPADAIPALTQDPSVAYIEEDRPVHMLQMLPGNEPPAPVQLIPEMVPWGIGGDDQTAGVRATTAGADGEGVNVGVLDTGIGPHPDLAVADGYNFVANSTDYADDVGHGTHVAGTIAALRNGVGVVGVAPKVRLYALKVLDSHGTGRASTVVAGLEWAVGHHLQVVNMSFGSAHSSKTEQRAIEDAAHAGITLVAAAGNDGGPVGYPAAYPSVIAVGAVDKSGQVASFSSRGPELSVVAPGVGILSTVPQTLGFSLSLATRGDSAADLGAVGMRYSASTPPDGVSGPVRFAGRGTKVDVAAVDLKGAVALMERGDISFGEKVANAAAAGAVGALIFNNQPGSYAGTLGSAGAIPALALSQGDGLAIKDGAGGPVRLLVSPNALYTRISGTSMASPHVAGVAALVLSVRPDLDPAGMRNILQQTATDLGPKGRDDSYGDGLVNATAAVKAARGLPAGP